MLYKVVLTLESVNGIPKHDYSNESYWACTTFFVVLFITLYNVVLTFEAGYNPKKRPLKWKLLSSTFLWSCSLCYAMWSVDEIRKCVHSNESYWTVLSWVRKYAAQGGSNFRVANGIPKLYDHSNESYWAVLSCSTGILLYKVVLTFESVPWNPKV